MSPVTFDPVTGELSAEVHQRHHLVAVLFEGAKLSVRHAIGSPEGSASLVDLREGIDRAVSIIDLGLRASLDCEGGGSLANRLDALYEYMIERLQSVRDSRDVDTLIEVLQLLDNISSAWEQIGTSQEAALA